MNNTKKKTIQNFKDNFNSSKESVDVSKILNESASKITAVNELRDSAEKFVEVASKDLRGEYCFYSVYKNSKEAELETYIILIHAFYKEVNITEDKIEEIILEDISLLNKKLQQTSLPIDYCFVMPYYDFINGESCLFNNLIFKSIENR